MIVLDTETTGLGERDEIIEIAIIGNWGEPLLNTLVKPSQVIPDDAIEIHHITNEMVANAPTWQDIQPIVAEIFAQRVESESTFKRVVAYNADFDRRMILQSGWNGELPPFYCAMAHVIAHLGIDYPHYALAKAADDLGIPFAGLTRHRAASDCAVTLDIMRKLRGLEPVATGDCADAFIARLARCRL